MTDYDERKIPAIIRAEAQARGWRLTEYCNVQNGITMYRMVGGQLLGFDRKRSCYVTD